MSNQLSRNEQDTIWRHFQTEGLAAFDLNNPRADFLVGLVPTGGPTSRSRHRNRIRLLRPSDRQAGARGVVLRPRR